MERVRVRRLGFQGVREPILGKTQRWGRQRCRWQRKGRRVGNKDVRESTKKKNFRKVRLRDVGDIKSFTSMQFSIIFIFHEFLKFLYMCAFQKAFMKNKHVIVWEVERSGDRELLSMAGSEWSWSWAPGTWFSFHIWWKHSSSLSRHLPPPRVWRDRKL